MIAAPAADLPVHMLKTVEENYPAAKRWQAYQATRYETLCGAPFAVGEGVTDFRERVTCPECRRLLGLVV